jgi:hypothetical protein
MTTLKKPVSRTTLTPLSGFYGPDRGKRLVVTISPGNGNDVPDLLTLRPHGTRRPETVALIDVYAWALRCRCNKANMDKLRAKKAAKADRLARARLARQVRRVNT